MLLFNCDTFRLQKSLPSPLAKNDWVLIPIRIVSGALAPCFAAGVYFLLF